MKRILEISFLLPLFGLFMLSCTSNRTVGNTLQDADIKAMFENYEYISNYNYFFTGYGNGPEAIAGINKDYELVKNRRPLRHTAEQCLIFLDCIVVCCRIPEQGHR